MSKHAFDKIAGGLEDAIAFMQGDDSRGRVVRGLDVRAVRAATNLSQNGFASAYRLKPGTVRDWEQGRRVPDAGSVTLLKMIKADPDGVKRILEKAEA